MAYVSIPKNLNEVKTTVFLNLTLREIVGIVIAGIVAFPLYFLSKKYIGNDMAILLFIATAIPFLFIAFYEKDGLKAEDIIKSIYVYSYYQPKRRVKKAIYLKRSLNINGKRKRQA